MGGIFSSPKAPAPPPPPPPAPTPPPVNDPAKDAQAQSDAAARVKQQSNAEGQESQILTGGQGDMTTATTNKKLTLGA